VGLREWTWVSSRKIYGTKNYLLTNIAMENFLSLHKKFVQLGRQKFKLTNEMLAILPEIYKSGIYKKYASSIVEYAGKYGGIPKSTVEKRLRIEKHLQDKPKLREAIKNVGLNKVAMVATLATPETEEAFVDKLENMSSPAVQTLSKELRQKSAGGDELSGETVCEAKAEKIKLELDEEMTFLFLKLKKKWGENISNKQIMRIILAKVSESEFPIRKLKTVLGEKLLKEQKSDEIAKPKIEIRYVPAHRRRKAKGNGQCIYPNCNKPATVFHHTDRFSESKSHESIVPLCKNHHEFMHNGLVQSEKEEIGNWRLDVTGEIRARADIFYRKYRQEVMF